MFLPRAFNIWMAIAPAAMMMLHLTACSDDDFILEEPSAQQQQQQQEALEGEVYVRLSMNMESGAPGRSSTASRAGEDPTTPGTPREDAINSIDLLIYDSSDFRLINVIHVEDTDSIGQLTTTEGLVLPIYAERGKIYLYAAVNFSTEMRQKFRLGRVGTEAVITSTPQPGAAPADEYKTLLTTLLPGSDGQLPGTSGQSAILPGEDAATGSATAFIPMTGQFVNPKGFPEISFTSDNTTRGNALKITADVSRIVSKMHLLTKNLNHPIKDSNGNITEHVDYAYTQAALSTQATPEGGTETFSNWIGWIRLANIRYIPNGVNKSTYLFPQANVETRQAADPAWKDPNMGFEGYFSGGLLDLNLCKADFVYYDPQALHDENVSSESHFGHAEAYDEGRYNATIGTAGATSTARYTKGMYCTENYFNAPAPNIADYFNHYEFSIPTITHMSIAAKLSPRRIVINRDFATKMDELCKFCDNNPDGQGGFYDTYGITRDDFNETHILYWNNVLKNRYFTSKPEYPPTEFREQYYLINTVSENDAAAIINWSLIYNKLLSEGNVYDKSGKYPKSTFFVYDMRYDNATSPETEWNQQFLYLTAGARNAATDANMSLKTYSVPHIGGWGYYYTYIGLPEENHKTPYGVSQVARNTYYIVKVDNFGVPGGTTTHPQYIKANTTAVGWDYAGRGDITLH